MTSNMRGVSLLQMAVAAERDGDAAVRAGLRSGAMPAAELLV